MENQENYIRLKKIINEVDPIGLIDFDIPESLDEYDAELKEIFKQDISLLNTQDLSELLHAVFIEFFNEELAGSKDKYELIANRYFDVKA